MLASRLQNPNVALRLSLGVILLGGFLAGLGTILRSLIDGQNDQWTYLLDTLGLVVTVLGAVLDFRTQARLGDIEIPGARRRAGLLLAIGGLCAIGGCFLSGWAIGSDANPVVTGILGAGMTSGLGMALAGLLYIGWFGGGDRLERRIQQRAEEEW
jgi:hypothetical protein